MGADTKYGQCSFCARTQEDGEKLIAGPDVNICSTCANAALIIAPVRALPKFIDFNDLLHERKTTALDLSREGKKCSFCGKYAHEIKWLVVHGEYSFCDECFGLIYEIILERDGKKYESPFPPDIYPPRGTRLPVCFYLGGEESSPKQAVREVICNTLTTHGIGLEDATFEQLHAIASRERLSEYHAFRLWIIDMTRKASGSEFWLGMCVALRLPMLIIYDDESSIHEFLSDYPKFRWSDPEQLGQDFETWLNRYERFLRS